MSDVIPDFANGRSKILIFLSNGRRIDSLQIEGLFEVSLREVPFIIVELQLCRVQILLKFIVLLIVLFRVIELLSFLELGLIY